MIGLDWQVTVFLKIGIEWVHTSFPILNRKLIQMIGFDWRVPVFLNIEIEWVSDRFTPFHSDSTQLNSSNMSERINVPRPFCSSPSPCDIGCPHLPQCPAGQLGPGSCPDGLRINLKKDNDNYKKIDLNELKTKKNKDKDKDKDKD